MKFLFELTAMVLTISMISCNGSGSETIHLNQPADTSNYTTVQWLDSVVNFGAIKMGEEIQIRFRVKNTGPRPLFLTDVQAVCGCTVADYTKGAIPAGGQGMITGSFDSKKSHVGVVRKSILVTTNSHNGIRHNLIFTGVINE